MRRLKHPQRPLWYDQGASLAKYLMDAHIRYHDIATVELIGVGVSMYEKTPMLFFCPIAHVSFNPQTLIRKSGEDPSLLLPHHVSFAPDTSRVADRLWQKHGYLHSMKFHMEVTSNALRISHLRIGEFVEMPPELTVDDPGSYETVCL